jgi:hypothetical protein
MIHFHWTEAAEVPNLAYLRDSLKKHGGSVVQYQKIFSLIAISRTTSHWEWVPAYSNRSWVGFKYALWCMVFGWWSLPGLAFTPGVILNNLIGGVNVTELLIGPPPLPGQSGQTAVAREFASAENRKYYVIVLMFVMFLLGIVLWIALSPSWP